jgi:hypothetical protein
MTNLETRLTTLENKTTFRQSIIDHTSINSPFNTLKETIINNQQYSTTIKTLVDDNVFPKTTHTLLTAYYTSYIETLPQTTDYKYTELESILLILHIMHHLNFVLK